MTDTTIDISGLDKAAVVAALYNRSKPLGMGFMHYDPEPMTAEQASKIIKAGGTHMPNNPLYFDYLQGRVMKVDLSGDAFDAWLYDRDNGQGAAREVIANLRLATIRR
jgi:hypothetical protein